MIWHDNVRFDGRIWIALRDFFKIFFNNTATCGEMHAVIFDMAEDTSTLVCTNCNKITAVIVIIPRLKTRRRNAILVAK